MSREVPPGTAWCGLHDIYYQESAGACWYCAQDAQRAGKVGEAAARCEREKEIRWTVERVAAARGITFEEALKLCIRVLEEQVGAGPDEQPPAAAARKAVGT